MYARHKDLFICVCDNLKVEMEVLRKTQEDLTSGQSQLDTMSQTITKETVSTLWQAVLYYFTDSGCMM